jgi:PTH1 family peptidyl-tRNA hydrolase
VGDEVEHTGIEQTMKLIIGLGNPGAQYERTRHNVGFHVVDHLANQQQWRWEHRGRAMITTGTIENEKVVLVKPLTYMNNSGEAVNELLHWYKLQPADILVVCDDLDLPVGQVRLRPKGSAGGHNGVSSIIHYLHTNDFARLRIGIGRPAHQRAETIDYVLGIPPLDEQIQLTQGEDKAQEAILLLLRRGLDTAMTTVNVDPEAQRKAEEKRQQKRERREEKRRLQAEESGITQET